MSDSISVSRVIPASPEAIFDLFADPKMHPVLDGSGTLRDSRSKNPDRLSLGAKFGMDMRWGVPYRILNTIVEFEEDKRIGWWHFARNIWRYELEPVDGGTRVTETYDLSRSWVPGAAMRALFKYPDHQQQSMAKTLENLERRFATS